MDPLSYGRLDDHQGGGKIGLNVPLQLNVGGYRQDVNVPVTVNPDGMGSAGQYVATRLQVGEEGHLPKGSWSDSLFDCTGNYCICFLATCCPCIQFGMTINRAFPIIGFFQPCGLYFMLLIVFGVLWWLGGVFLPFEYLWIPACILYLPLSVLGAWYRTKIRNKYDIMGSIIWDTVVHWFCEPCSIAQEARHVERDYGILNV